MTVSLAPFHRRAPSLAARNAALALTAAIALSMPFAAQAQGPEALPSPALEGIAETSMPRQATPAAEPAETVSPPPAAGPFEAAPAAPNADTHSVPAAIGKVQSEATGAPSAGMHVPEIPAAKEADSESVAPEPARSLLEDSAAAISQMLEPVERDPKLPHNLSPWGMFMAADRVVKGVMIGLVFASLLTWTIWLAKSVEIACARGRARRALKAIADAPSLADAAHALAGRGGPAAFMVRTATSEMNRSKDVLDHAGDKGLLSRILSHLMRVEAHAGRRLSRGTGVLATIGSTAPFVGLFGTVWGIMNAFIGISEAQTTNLAVVAPGIAEALLATALGLVAAIPAVVIYNVFARSISGYRQLLGDASAAVERLVSLDLDWRKVPPASTLAAE